MTPVAAFPDVALADIGAELRREIEARRRLYPRRVASGRMTEDEAAHGVAIAEALLADLGRVHPMRSRREGHAFSWHARRAMLQRELAMRGRLYPGWIHEGRLDAAQAKVQIRRLEALLWIFEDGFDWRPAGDLPLPYWRDGDDHHAARVEWHATYAAVQLARAARCPNGDQAGDHCAMAEGLIQVLRLDHAHDQAAELEAKLQKLRTPEQQKELAL